MKVKKIELFGLIFSLALLKIMVWILKFIIQSPRPPSAELWLYNPSFPSGVAADAGLAACILSSNFPRYSLLFHFLGITIAASRVYVGVHYPIDIIAGYIIGILWFISAHKIIIKWLK